VTSIHQSTNLVLPNFILEFFSVLTVEKENKKNIGSKKVFFECGPMKSLFSFLTAQTEKNLWKKNGVNKIDGLMSQKRYMVDQKSPKFGLKIVFF